MKTLIKLLVVVLILVAAGKGAWMYILYTLQGGALSSEDKKLQAELSARLENQDFISLESDLFPDDWDMVCLFQGSSSPYEALEYLNISGVDSYEFEPDNLFTFDGYWVMAFINKSKKTVKWHEFYGPDFYWAGFEECTRRESGLGLKLHEGNNAKYLRITKK